MPDIFLLFSHQLTAEQQKDLKQNWQVKNIIYLPPELQILWSQVPPDIPELNSYLKPLKNWLKQHAQKGDLVLIQGDSGAVYLMVNYALQLGLIPIYATTKRIVKEKTDSNGHIIIERLFCHQGFRMYGR